MKKKLIIILALACTLILAACSVPKSGESPSLSGTAASVPSQTSEVDPYHKITAEEAKKMMDVGGVVVVDVRTAEEYAQKHIPGAILVLNESIGEELPEAPFSGGFCSLTFLGRQSAGVFWNLLLTG